MSVAWTLADHHALQRATQAASVPPNSRQLYQQRFVVGRSKTQGEAATQE